MRHHNPSATESAIKHTMKQKELEQDFSFSGLNVVSVGKSAKSLPDLVAEQLLDAIQEGVLPEGQRLKEEKLAERFDVSRSTIREAIALLERKGVVERTPRQGARVVTIGADEIEEIFLIRSQLLGLAANLFAEHASSAHVNDFISQVQQLTLLAENAETHPEDYANASIAAQRTLISFGNRNRLKNIYEELSNAALWRFVVRERAISFTTNTRRKESAQDWQRVASAIQAREPLVAEACAKNLLMHSYIAVKKVLLKPQN